MIHEIIDLDIDYKGLGLENGGYSPKLYTYILDNFPEIDMNRRRPTIVICPGGGYEFTSNREAEAVAIRLNSFGYNAVILRYSIAPALFPTALVELATVVKLLRKNAEKWHVDESKVLVAGFSAGGHLACSFGTFWNKAFLQKLMNGTTTSWRPDGMILCYPVITSGEFAHRGSFNALLGKNKNDSDALELVSLEKQVSKDTPPTFIWHTYTDDGVPVENSLLLADALRKENISTELHIYSHGFHGLGLANEETRGCNGFGIQEECQSWTSLLNTWIKFL